MKMTRSDVVRAFVMLSALVTLGQPVRSQDLVSDMIMWSYADLYNDTALRIIYQGRVDLLQYTLSPINLGALDARQLRLLRNAIFAQHGYAFASEDLRHHFGQFEWYSPRYANVDSRLDDVDRYNIQMVQRFETRDPRRAPVVTVDEITGHWEELPIVAGGHANHFVFTADGAFRFTTNEMNPIQRLISFSGTFTISGNILHLEIHQEVFQAEAELAWHTSADGTEYYLTGGERVTINLTIPRHLYLAITPKTIVQAEAIGRYVERASISIGSWPLYQLFADSD